MNLLVAEAGATKADVERAHADAVVVDAPSAPVAQARQLVRVRLDTARDGLCRGLQGSSFACPHDPNYAAEIEARLSAVARTQVDGIVLEQPEAWYAAGPGRTGDDEPCRAALARALSTRLAEQYDPHAMPEDGAFARARSALRWHAALESTAHLVRRARDEARASRSKELLVGATFAGLGPAAIALGKHLDFSIFPAPAPSPDRSRVSTYELFRAGLGVRPAVGRIDDATAGLSGLVLQAARLAAATGTFVTLPASAPEASRAALAQHRARWKEWRSHHRASEPAAELVVLYSPVCDHWSSGRHGSGVRAALEALTLLGLQYRVVTTMPRSGTEPVVVADAGALPELESMRLERRINDGAGAIVVGACGAVDDEGRPLPAPFGSIDEGLNAVGQGTVLGVRLERPADGEAERRWEPLLKPLEQASESLLGRGRRTVSVSGAQVVVKCWLDPEKRLDVHLVGRTFDPATGAAAKVSKAVLHLSGAVASGSRSGLLLLEDGQERKIALAPFGMGVQAALPEFTGAALFTVAR